jgi:hypothetical protein
VHTSRAHPHEPQRVDRPSPPAEEVEVECDLCARKFPTKNGMLIHRSRQHVIERTCEQEGCDTVLSRFNQNRWCAAHEHLHAPGTIGRAAGA